MPTVLTGQHLLPPESKTGVVSFATPPPPTVSGLLISASNFLLQALSFLGVEGKALSMSDINLDEGSFLTFVFFFNGGCFLSSLAQMNQIKDNPNKAESWDKIFKRASPTQFLRQNKNKTSFEKLIA